VSFLWKAELDPSRILSHVSIEIREDLTVNMKPIRILEHNIRELRNKKFPLVRVLWKNSKIDEKIWERESEMMKRYSSLFSGMKFI
jgi:hypothetical protein